MQNDTIKGLPLNELEVVGLLQCCGDYEDTETGDTRPEYEMEFINKGLHEQASYQGAANRCACCGHALKLACLCVHRPTLAGYYIGRDCAAKVQRLQAFGFQIKNASVALTERIACTKREADFLKAHPEAKDAYVYARDTNFAPAIAKDIVQKIRRFGEPTVNQLALLVKLVQEDIAKRAQATATCTAGRQIVKGRVLGLKEKPGFGYKAAPITKMLVDTGTGVKLWGTVPERMVEEVTKGCVVEFSGTIEPSKDDPLFGFVKRPNNLRVVEKAPQNPA